jgi:hypothetical protein
MMKKVMFVVVMLLVASTCFAQLQSPPSNVTGYVKITALASSFTPFGLPFQFWDVPAGGVPTYGVESTRPSDIVGDQTNPGNSVTADLIWRQDNGNTAFRTPANVWTGTLEDNQGMSPGRAFWYRNRTAANRNLVLAGQVNNAGSYGVVPMPNTAYTPYSWRDSRSVDRSQLNLLTSGFTGGTLSSQSDQVLQQGAGAFFWRRTNDSSWQGTLVTVEPGIAYWIFNRNHGNGTWNYDYIPGGAAAVSNDNVPTSKDNGVSISKINTGTKTKATAGSTRE